MTIWQARINRALYIWDDLAEAFEHIRMELL